MFARYTKLTFEGLAEIGQHKAREIETFSQRF